MSLWTTLRGMFSSRNKMTPDDWWDRFGGSHSIGGVSVTSRSAFQVSTFQACVSIRSEDFAKLPGHVYKRRRDGGRKIVADHPVERLLQRPNGYQSWFEFAQQMHARLLVHNNAYAAIIRDYRGNPIALIPVLHATVYASPDGSVFYNAARSSMHEVAMLSSLPQMIPSEDMLHLRSLAFQNSLIGDDKIVLMREAVALAISQQGLAGRLSANSTNLGGVLTTEQKLGPQAIARLSSQWKKTKAGYANAGETAVLEQGLKWQALGMTASDAQFDAQRAFQVEDIARYFRMPMHKLGVSNKGTAGSIEQLDQEYYNGPVSSDCCLWEQKVTQCFNLPADLFVEFDVSKLLRASLQVRYNALRTGIVGMFLTPNEARRSEGLPDHPEGDTLYQPTNVAPIGFEPAGKETGPGSDVTGSVAPGGRGDPAAVEDESSSS